MEFDRLMMLLVGVLVVCIVAAVGLVFYLSTGPVERLPAECPVECCAESEEFLLKECGTGFECLEGKCVDEKPNVDPCSFECCLPDEEGIEEKSCASGFECIEHACVKIMQSCPFECCGPDSEYKEAGCDEGFKCIDENCVEIGAVDCPFECCGSLDYAYKTKACPAGKTCYVYSHTCRQS